MKTGAFLLWLLVLSLLQSSSAPAAYDTGDAVSPQQFGAVGNGVVNDTAAVQAALNSAVANDLPLVFDGKHKYLIAAPGLSSSGIAVLLGNSGNVSIYATSCPSGLIVNSNITALTLTGLTARVENLCIQMGTADGQRSSGAAIAIGSTVSTGMGNASLINNTILFPYDGIVVGGPAGGQQTNGLYLEKNSVRDPTHWGIANGPVSTAQATVGTTFAANKIACYGPNAMATGVGYALFDGAIDLDASDNGPYGCNIGMLIKPGANQRVNGRFTGVIGDSSKTNELLIDTADPTAAVFALRFSGAWFSTVTASGAPVRIQNTGAGQVWGITFIGSNFVGGPGMTAPIIDLAAGTNLIIDSNLIWNDGVLGQSGPGIRINGAGYLSITNNMFRGTSAFTGAGIQIPSTGPLTGIYNIQGNNFERLPSPISYTPNRETAIIKNNVGIDNFCPNVVSAASISIPNAAPCVLLTGSTAITDLTNSAWSARQVLVRSADGVSFNIGGALNTKFCTAFTLAAQGSRNLIFDTSFQCWAPI